jgi:Uma2 family endonuclease
MSTPITPTNPEKQNFGLSGLMDLDLSEIIEGKRVMTPSPFVWHQRIVSRLSRKMAEYVEKHGLGEVFIAPLDVILESEVNRLQPDIVFVKKENMSIVQDWIRGTPDVVVEVISRGTYTRDAVQKKDIYEKYGIPEYWLVIPELKTISVFTLGNGKYRLFSSAEEQGKVESQVIAGLEIPIDQIFIS